MARPVRLTILQTHVADRAVEALPALGDVAKADRHRPVDRRSNPARFAPDQFSIDKEYELLRGGIVFEADLHPIACGASLQRHPHGVRPLVRRVVDPRLKDSALQSHVDRVPGESLVTPKEHHVPSHGEVVCAKIERERPTLGNVESGGYGRFVRVLDESEFLGQINPDDGLLGGPRRPLRRRFRALLGWRIGWRRHWLIFRRRRGRWKRRRLSGTIAGDCRVVSLRRRSALTRGGIQLGRTQGTIVYSDLVDETVQIALSLGPADRQRSVDCWDGEDRWSQFRWKLRRRRN